MMKHKKKVLYIGNNTSLKTNYGSSILLLSSLLNKEGFNVRISSSKQNKFFRLIDMCHSVFKTRKKIDYLLIDVFSSISFYFAFFTSQIARIFGIKYITILRGGNLPYRLVSSKIMSKLIFSNSYKNVAPSNYLKTKFEKRGFKVDYIPNTIEIENYAFLEREKMKPYILWVRAFKELYNPTLAIKVLRIVKNKYPEVNLCMVGPKKDISYEKTVKLIKELGLSNSVKLTGVMEKKEWHKMSVGYDIMINTTNFDNTPNSIIEAMALGLPVVSTNVGGMPYLLENTIDGILVDKENPEHMAAAIIKLIEENNQIIAKNARKKAESFGWNEIKHKWIKILK